MTHASEALSRSLARGAIDVALIEQTLGDFFDAMVARRPGHEALVSVHRTVLVSRSPNP